MRDIFVADLLNKAKIDKRINLVTGDLGFGVLTKFAEELPEQYLNAGVAEQNMLGLSAGMALDGKIVFVYSIANFPTIRALEQIRNDAAYHDANVKVVSIGGGFSYGALGMSHHATEDLAIMRAIPQIKILAPGCLWEAEHAVGALIESEGTCYLRLDKSSAGRTNRPGEVFEFGKMRRLREGNQGVIFAIGGILEVALKAADELATKGIKIRVYSVHSLCPFDLEELLLAIKECRNCFTLEEHIVGGGLGGLIAESCLEAGVLPEIFYRFGVRGGFSSVVGSQDYLRSTFGLDAKTISKKVEDLVSKADL